ncbi:MAG: DNA repair protein RecO [Planctomycetota bacterium]
MGASKKTIAIVMRRSEFLESSRIVRLCTRDFGCLSFLAKGAHRPRSPFLGAIDLLHVCEATVRIKAGRGLQNLYSLKVLQGNRAFQTDARRRQLAYHLSDSIRMAMPEGRPDPALFDLYRGGLTLFAVAASSCLATILAGIRLRMLRILGLLPRLDSCPRSGLPLPERGRVAFSPAEGGFLHPKEGGRRVSAELPRLANRLVELEGMSLGRTSVPRGLLEPLESLLEELLAWHLGERPRVRTPDNLFVSS